MGHPKVAALAVLLGVGLTSCASLRWSVQRSFRPPGEHLESFPELVWAEYDCASQQRPFLVIEENELLPPRVRAGGAFNHRLIYAMCPQRPTEVVSGRLQTRIRYRGHPIVRETTEDYEIKPGRWVVDAEVTLPSDAGAGVYAYEISFVGGAVHFEKSLTFVVRR